MLTLQVLAAAGEYLEMFGFSDDTTFIPYKPTETTCGQQVYLVSALADPPLTLTSAAFEY